MKLRGLLALAVIGGCMSADKPKAGSATEATTTPPAASAALPLVTTIAEAVAAKGTRVRVRGTAQREKSGDTLQVEEMSVVCVGATFPDAVIGTTAEASGTLVVAEAFTATPGGGAGSGPVRQGKPAGAKQWQLTGCTIP